MLLRPFYPWGNWDSVRWSILPKAKEQVGGGPCVFVSQTLEDPFLRPFSAGEKLAGKGASWACRLLLWENFKDRQLPLLPCEFLLIHLRFQPDGHSFSRLSPVDCYKNTLSWVAYNTQQMFISHRLGSPRSRWLQIRCLVKARFLVYRWCLLTGLEGQRMSVPL